MLEIVPSKLGNEAPMRPEYSFDNFKTAIAGLLEELKEIRAKVSAGKMTAKDADLRRVEIVTTCREMAVQEQAQMEEFYEGRMPAGHQGAVGAFYQVMNPHNVPGFEATLGVDALERKVFEEAVNADIQKSRQEVSGVQASTTEDMADIMNREKSVG